jgi:hypothetical protein
MWRYIFNNLQVQVAITLDAETDEEAQTALGFKLAEAAKMGIDLPHVSTFQVVSKVAL